MELYSKVRMAVLRDGVSQRETARRFGIDRGTVAKMVGHAAPPGYRHAGARVRPKLDAHSGFIDEVLKADLTAPKKQRHTILRLFERLRDERGVDRRASGPPISAEVGPQFRAEFPSGRMVLKASDWGPS